MTFDVADRSTWKFSPTEDEISRVRDAHVSYTITHGGSPDMAALPPHPEERDHSSDQRMRRTRARMLAAMLLFASANTVQHINRQAYVPPETARARVRPGRSRNIP